GKKTIKRFYKKPRVLANKNISATSQFGSVGGGVKPQEVPHHCHPEWMGPEIVMRLDRHLTTTEGEAQKTLALAQARSAVIGGVIAVPNSLIVDSSPSG
ncbi:13032_t:CDS:2, partial [Acaulospora colombiana]